MKSSSIAATLSSALLSGVTARIQAHSYLHTEPLFDDVFQVHMSVTDENGENPRIVCRGGSSEFFSSDQTEVCLNFDNGGCKDPAWGVCSFGNTREVIVYHNGYPEYVNSINNDFNNVDCAPCGKSGCAQCGLWESCFGDTDDCPICDGRAGYGCLEGDRSDW